MIVTFIDNQRKIPEICLYEPKIKSINIVLEFSKFSTILKISKKQINLFIKILERRNNYKFSINFKNIYQIMIGFFQNKPLRDWTLDLNDFENLFLGVFIIKKKFLQWSDKEYNLISLQQSKTKKRKEHFLKFILKKLFKYLKNKKLSFFGKNNENITQQMKSIFFETTNKSIQKNSKLLNKPNKNRMDRLGILLASNLKFKEFYEKSNMDLIILEIFNEYCEKPMKKLITNHIERFKNYMEIDLNQNQKIKYFVKMIFKINRSKQKIMWTFQEFKQAQIILDSILKTK